MSVPAMSVPIYVSVRVRSPSLFVKSSNCQYISLNTANGVLCWLAQHFMSDGDLMRGDRSIGLSFYERPFVLRWAQDGLVSNYNKK
jgi:hypothetical protein